MKSLRSLMLCAIATVTACGVTDVDHLGLIRQQLDTARTQWRNDGYSDYTIVLRRTCPDCVGGTEPAAIVVQNGVRVSGTFVDDSQPVPASELSLYLTVEELFDFIEDAIDENADEILVSYGSIGYPTSIFVDYVSGTLNDERGYAITSVDEDT